MKKSILRNYARLIAQKGGNIQKGQDVIIRASLDQPEFVRMLVEECYALGARQVRVEWSYLPVTKINQKKCSLKTLSKMEEWEVAKLKHESETLPVTIW
ncbi:MAG: aminopeptidase, partial [Clostridia bacterium]|nr:aminopeptidase [Clostridia bacterium]